jgi:hypothetical protein
MSAFLLFFARDLLEGFVGTISHAQGLFLTPALVASLIDAPTHDPGLGVTENLDAAPLRPETSRVMKGTDQLADFASIAEFRIARDSVHRKASLIFERVGIKIKAVFCPSSGRTEQKFNSQDRR